MPRGLTTYDQLQNVKSTAMREYLHCNSIAMEGTTVCTLFIHSGIVLPHVSTEDVERPGSNSLTLELGEVRPILEALTPRFPSSPQYRHISNHPQVEPKDRQCDVVTHSSVIFFEAAQQRFSSSTCRSARPLGPQSVSSLQKIFRNATCSYHFTLTPSFCSCIELQLLCRNLSFQITHCGRAVKPTRKLVGAAMPLSSNSQD